MKRFIDLNVGGGTTDIARPIKARYGALGNQSYVPKHKGESSGVMETIKVKDGTSKGYSECPIGGWWTWLSLTQRQGEDEYKTWVRL